MAPLRYLERPGDGDPAGLLVLHHGRGTDAADLIGLADLLDPGRRLHVVAPRGPLTLPGAPGYHWYVVHRIGFPDPESFHAARAALGEFHDELWERTGVAPSATVFAGFSMGTVMSYAMGLGNDRPPVAGILAFSGFIPVVDGWRPSFADRPRTRLLIAHGSNDPLIGVEMGHQARDLAEAGGLDVTYLESPVDHQIDPAHLRAATAWLAETLPADPS